MRRLLFALAAMPLAAGCTATHMLQAPLPDTGSESFAPAQVSATTLWANSAKPLAASRCVGGAGMSHARAHTMFGDSLLTVLSLGFRQRVRMDYACAKTPTGPEPIEP
jgi:hypothetical protein